MFLPLGDYTLQDEITYAIGSGEVFGGVDVDATLVPAAVPTPEPRSTPFILVFGYVWISGVAARNRLLDSPTDPHQQVELILIRGIG